MCVIWLKRGNCQTAILGYILAPFFQSLSERRPPTSNLPYLPLLSLWIMLSHMWSVSESQFQPSVISWKNLNCALDKNTHRTSLEKSISRCILWSITNFTSSMLGIIGALIFTHSLLPLRAAWCSRLNPLRFCWVKSMLGTTTRISMILRKSLEMASWSGVSPYESWSGERKNEHAAQWVRLLHTSELKWYCRFLGLFLRHDTAKCKTPLEMWYERSRISHSCLVERSRTLFSKQHYYPLYINRTVKYNYNDDSWIFIIKG